LCCTYFLAAPLNPAGGLGSTRITYMWAWDWGSSASVGFLWLILGPNFCLLSSVEGKKMTCYAQQLKRPNTLAPHVLRSWSGCSMVVPPKRPAIRVKYIGWTSLSYSVSCLIVECCDFMCNSFYAIRCNFSTITTRFKTWKKISTRRKRRRDEYFQSRTLERLQLLHKNCSVLHAINCTWNHVIKGRFVDCTWVSLARAVVSLIMSMETFLSRSALSRSANDW